VEENARMDGTGMHIGYYIQKEFLTAKNESNSIEFGWTLVSGLPDDVAKHFFALVPRIHFHSLSFVCKSFIPRTEICIVRRHVGTM